MNAEGSVTAPYDPSCDLPAVEVLKRHGKSFHFAGRLLSPAHIRDASQLYEFCRFADDLVDHAEYSNRASDQLETIREDLQRGQSDFPPVARFLEMAERCECNLDVAHELLTGLRSDLEQVCIDDERQLLRYCYRVAGTVGILMCDVFAVRDREALPFAVDLGIGMQLTNIVRDICDDARAGRRYVPSTLLPDCDLDQLATGSEAARPALRQAAVTLLSLADRYYRSGEAGLSYLPSRPRLAILIAARVYHAIGTKIAGEHHAVWQGRVSVGTGSKVCIAGHAVTRYISRGFLRTLPRAHDASLHRHLTGFPGTHGMEASAP